MRKFIAGLLFIFLFTGCSPEPGTRQYVDKNTIAVTAGNGIADFEVHFIEKNGNKFAVAACQRGGVSIIQIQE